MELPKQLLILCQVLRLGQFIRWRLTAPLTLLRVKPNTSTQAGMIVERKATLSRLRLMAITWQLLRSSIMWLLLLQGLARILLGQWQLCKAQANHNQAYPIPYG